MARKRQPGTEQQLHARKRTPTFLLELPLRVTSSQAKRLRAHLEAARQFYNAVLSEGQRRLRRMRADPGRLLAPFPVPRSWNGSVPFGRCEQSQGFAEYALHDAAKTLNCSWIADHVDAVLAQTLATRAYRALKEGLSGPGPPGPLQEPRTRPGECRE